MEVWCSPAAIFCWCLLASLALCSQTPHDGSTVTAMLARLGLGPAAAQQQLGCEEEGAGSCSSGSAVVAPPVQAIPEHMCWGYEEGCTGEKRLFVPKCDGSPTPW